MKKFEIIEEYHALRYENVQLKAKIKANDVKEDFNNYCELRKQNEELISENYRLKSELERAIKLPERQIEKNIDAYASGNLGKGFDIGWNTCLDRINLLRKLEEVEQSLKVDISKTENTTSEVIT